MEERNFDETHWLDSAGRSAGGCTTGVGFTISWQNGPLGRDGDRKKPNGAFVEDIIDAAIGRLEFCQSGQFASEYNERAIAKLRLAVTELNNRTADREKRAVEGTHAQ
jgi:hypothetical protein